jgi:hypothetical protein
MEQLSTPVWERRWRSIGLILIAFILVGAVAIAYLHPNFASRSQPTASPTPPQFVALAIPYSLADRCSNPTAKASTAVPRQVGSADAPRVGPVTFHPYPFTIDPKTNEPYPTKVLINPVVEDGEVITLLGESCAGAGPLLFGYHDQIPSLATASVSFRMNVPPNEAFAGYMEFTSAGDWCVDVFSANEFIGNVVITVAVPLSPAPS